jgi:hypothetical protein
MPFKQAAPGDSLRLDLDFKWSLSDLKIRPEAPERANKKRSRDDADSYGFRLEEREWTRSYTRCWRTAGKR